MWPNVTWLTRQILTIHGSQIEIEEIFSIVGVLTSLRRCRFGAKNLDSLLMIYKNWPNDARVECNLANENDIKCFATQAYLLETHEVKLNEAMMFEKKYVVCGFYIHISALGDAVLKLGMSSLLNSRL
jgi:hypothetical protein